MCERQAGRHSRQTEKKRAERADLKERGWGQGVVVSEESRVLERGDRRERAVDRVGEGEGRWREEEETAATARGGSGCCCVGGRESCSRGSGRSGSVGSEHEEDSGERVEGRWGSEGASGRSRRAVYAGGGMHEPVWSACALCGKRGARWGHCVG